MISPLRMSLRVKPILRAETLEDQRRIQTEISIDRGQTDKKFFGNKTLKKEESSHSYTNLKVISPDFVPLKVSMSRQNNLRHSVEDKE